ncbi:hypothetical protein M569_15727, partial [Genlisea aurea]
MSRHRTISPIYGRQSSGGSSSTGSSSPAHPRLRSPQSSSGMSTIRRTQNVAAKAAAQRLALAMASKTPKDEEEEEDDDLEFRFVPPVPSPVSSNTGVINRSDSGGFSGIGFSKTYRSPSPGSGRNIVDATPVVRSSSAGRPSMTNRSTIAVATHTNSSLRTPAMIPPIDLPSGRIKEKMFMPFVGRDLKNSADHETSALRDELDMLQEENEVMLEKLRLAEAKRDESEARARELEKQVASLGEGVTLEAKLLSRKEASLRQREAALKSAQQTKDGRDEELAFLRAEIEKQKHDVATAMEQVREAEAEAKSLRTMTHRMILTHEEMEEVAMKRCWLSRYWGLAAHYGICADVSVSKHEHWSSFAPLPFEVVTSAGQKAQEETWDAGGDGPDKSKRDLNDIVGEGNIETMLSVEMGLKELASLKIEDAVLVALYQDRRSTLIRHSFPDPKSSSGDHKFLDAFALTQEEIEDVLFKEAWLTYFWRRAKVHGVEEDVAEDRLQLWVGRSGQTPTSHDAVDVERGLIELRKLGIEQQLWEASRKEIGHGNGRPSLSPSSSSSSHSL